MSQSLFSHKASSITAPEKIKSYNKEKHTSLKITWLYTSIYKTGIFTLSIRKKNKLWNEKKKGKKKTTFDNIVYSEA